MELTKEQAFHEEQMKRVEVTLLTISDTMKRTGWKRDELVQMGADQHLIDALDRSIKEMDEIHTRLMQGTYWYVSPEEMAAAKAKSKARRMAAKSGTHSDAVSQPAVSNG